MTQPESRLSKAIQEYLRKQKAWCFKVHGSAMQPSGIPDILGTYRGLFIGVESKMPGNDLSEIQRFRITRIRDAGGLVCIAYSVGDVQQFLFHIDQHHTGTECQATANSPLRPCALYGKGAPLHAIH